MKNTLLSLALVLMGVLGLTLAISHVLSFTEDGDWTWLVWAAVITPLALLTLTLGIVALFTKDEEAK